MSCDTFVPDKFSTIFILIRVQINKCAVWQKWPDSANINDASEATKYVHNSVAN